MVSIVSKHNHLIKILRRIKAEQKTVQLQVTYNGSTVSLYFIGGYVAFVHDFPQKDKIGDYFVRNELVTRNHIRKALIKQREFAEANRTIKIGTILVDMGFTTKKKIQICMKARIVGTFINIFEADYVSLVVLSDADTMESDITADGDIERLLTEARFARRNKKTRMEGVSPDDVFTASAEISQQQGLSSDDWKIIALLDGKRTILELSCVSNLSTLQVYPIIESLLEREIIKYIDNNPELKPEKVYLKFTKPAISVLYRILGRLRRV